MKMTNIPNPSELKDIDLDIKTDEPTTVRELEPGQHFITLGHLRRGKVTPYNVRVRTDDPYNSLTFLGSRVSTFPSERVFPVKVIHQPTLS